MHAHQGRTPRKVSADQGNVLLAVHFGSVRDHAEITVARRQCCLGNAPDVPLISHPVANHFGDGQQRTGDADQAFEGRLRNRPRRQ